MPSNFYQVKGVRVFACAPEGKTLGADRDAVDLIAAAQGADLILIPMERLDEDFFRLRTRMAGGFIQKFVTYGRRLAIAGDISGYVAESTAFRDFVYELNRGAQVWFVADADELSEKIRAADWAT